MASLTHSQVAVVTTRLLICTNGYCCWEVRFSYDSAWFMTLEVWCLLFSHCVRFVHLSWNAQYACQTETQVRVLQFWKVLLIYSFSNSLPSTFLCCPSLELVYVWFLTTRIESPICVSLLFPSLSPSTPWILILGRFLCLSLLSLLLIVLLQFRWLAIVVLKYAYFFVYWFFSFLFYGYTVCAYFSNHTNNVFFAHPPCFCLVSFFLWITSFIIIFSCSSCCRITSGFCWYKWLNINALPLYLRAI